MRNNTYSNNAYPRRNPSRFKETEKVTLGKRLGESLVTQFTICALVTGTIFGAQALKLPNINESVTKIKTMITYSPSLKEFASSLKAKIKSPDQGYELEEMPIIIVDDEIF